MSTNYEYSLVLLISEFADQDIDSKILIFDGGVDFSEMSGSLSGNLICNFDSHWGDNIFLKDPIQYVKKLSDRHEFEIYKFKSKHELKTFCFHKQNFGTLWESHADSLYRFLDKNLVSKK